MFLSIRFFYLFLFDFVVVVDFLKFDFGIDKLDRMVDGTSMT